MRRIIVVDDDPGIQEAFELVFDPAQFEVEVHEDGDWILKSEFALPDLFILDKQLSGVDGLDICRFLKKGSRTKHIPVIMLSASAQIHVLAKVAGAEDAIEKPFSLKTIRETAARYILCSSDDDARLPGEIRIG